MILTEKKLNWILYGTAFLGSGGGGSIEIGKAFIKEILDSKQEVKLLTFPIDRKIEDLNACIIADIGAISASDPYQSTALVTAFRELQHYIDLISNDPSIQVSKPYHRLGKITAVFPIELGPENTLAPILLAAKEPGLVVVDADGARRAVPTLDLCTFATFPEGKRDLLASIGNGQEDTLIVKSNEVKKFEKLLRPICNSEEFNQSASLAIWPDKLSELINRSIIGSISIAMQFGKMLEGIQTGNEDMVQEAIPFVNTLKGFLIGGGKIIHIEDKGTQAFDWRTIIVEDRILGGHTTVLVQNENLIAYNENFPAPVGLAPDSICYINEKREPLTTAEIAKNQCVYLIGVKADRRVLENKWILQNYRSILHELGYAGLMKSSHVKQKPLGDLIRNLPNIC